MVEQYTCSFCGVTLEPGTGKMFVKKDGTIFYFCSTKCENNHKLGRVPRGCSGRRRAERRRERSEPSWTARSSW